MGRKTEWGWFILGDLKARIHIIENFLKNFLEKTILGVLIAILRNYGQEEKNKTRSL